MALLPAIQTHMINRLRDSPDLFSTSESIPPLHRTLDRHLERWRTQIFPSPCGAPGEA